MRSKSVYPLILALIVGLLPSLANSQDLPEIISAVKPAVVFVLAVAPDGSAVSGSGVLIHPDGYVLTAHHVIDGAEKILVSLPIGRLRKAERIASNRSADSALLRIPGANYPAVPLELARRAKPGDKVLIFGYGGKDAIGGDPTVTRGLVSGLQVDGLIELDAGLNPGDSGAPVVNYQGTVVGIAVRGSRDYAFGLAVPVETAKGLLSSIPAPLPSTNSAIQRPRSGEDISAWPIVPGLSVGVLRLGMTRESVSAFLGAPETSCTTTLRRMTPLPGYPETTRYYPAQGMELDFGPGGTLGRITVMSNTIRHLERVEISIGGGSLETVCDRYGDVSMRGGLQNLQAEGVDLGSSVERVRQTFGTPESERDTRLSYGSKGIAFQVQAGQIIKIIVYPPD